MHYEHLVTHLRRLHGSPYPRIITAWTLAVSALIEKLANCCDYRDQQWNCGFGVYCYVPCIKAYLVVFDQEIKALTRNKTLGLTGKRVAEKTSGGRSHTIARGGPTEFLTTGSFPRNHPRFET